MTRRQDLIDIIQSLSAEEGTRQPTAADWLKSQEVKVAPSALAGEIIHDEGGSDHGSSSEDP